MRKTVVISGSSRGLGLALAHAFGAAGWSLVINGRDVARLDRARRELARAGYMVLAVAADLTEADAPERLVAEVNARFGGFSLLINNAGVLGPAPRPVLADARPEGIRAALEGNLLGPIRLTQAALPTLRVHAGTVICVTSDAAKGGYPGWGVYGLTKAALELATRTWAAEERQVRFHLVDPGDLRTGMQQAAFPREDISDRLDPAEVTDAFLMLATAPETGLRVRAAEFRAARRLAG